MSRSRGPLAGRVAIVTGASSGIGRATALRLAAAGAKVVAAARRVDRLEALQARAPEENAFLVVPTDVTSRRAMEALAALTLDRFGTIDILVNNAGVMHLAELSRLDVADWEWMIDVNVKGVLYGIAAVLPAMLQEGRGHIVNVGSLAGRRPFPGGTVYAATKHAVRALSRGMQLELSAATKIRITDLEPGVVRSELAENIRDPEARAAFLARWEDKRPLEPADVAEAILFAVSAPDRVNVSEILVRPTDQET
ncbi:MAG: SDR family oxidoreductase [Gemmatimonadota bacterium]